MSCHGISLPRSSTHNNTTQSTYRLEKGTTYNAYLIFGETHTALVDASHEKFSNLFIATLKEQLAAAGRGIDYVLVRQEGSVVSTLFSCGAAVTGVVGTDSMLSIFVIFGGGDHRQILVKAQQALHDAVVCFKAGSLVDMHVWLKREEDPSSPSGADPCIITACCVVLCCVALQ